MNVLITLPIYYDTDETSTLERMGVDTPVTAGEIRHVTFYTIDAIAPYIDGEIKCCSIFIGGERFICSQTHEEVYMKLKPFADESIKR